MSKPKQQVVVPAILFAGALAAFMVTLKLDNIQFNGLAALPHGAPTGWSILPLMVGAALIMLCYRTHSDRQMNDRVAKLLARPRFWLFLAGIALIVAMAVAHTESEAPSTPGVSLLKWPFWVAFWAVPGFTAIGFGLKIRRQRREWASQTAILKDLAAQDREILGRLSQNRPDV